MEMNVCEIMHRNFGSINDYMFGDSIWNCHTDGLV